MDKHKELNLREGLGGRKFNFSNCEELSLGRLYGEFFFLKFRLYGELSFMGGLESSK